MSLEKNLKRLQYHWFWGLRQVPESHEPNLWMQVEEWKNQPDELESIRRKQVKISLKFWLIRFFYWLFNIAHYAENHYKLAAYFMVIKPFQMMLAFNLNTLRPREIARILRGFNLITYMEQTVSSECSEGTDSEASSRESNSPSPATESTQEGSHSVRKEFISVKGWMLTHLAVLGIHKAYDEVLSFLELRRAYLQKAIATHPDKHPDDDRAKTIFQSVVQAYEVLNKAFEDAPGKTLVSQDNANLSADTDELRRDYEAMRQECERRVRSFDAIMAELLTLEKKLEVNRQRVEVNRRRGEEQDRQLEEIRQVIEARARHRAQAAAPAVSSHPVHEAGIHVPTSPSPIIDSRNEPDMHTSAAQTGNAEEQAAPRSPLSQLGHFAHPANEASSTSQESQASIHGLQQQGH